jgi:3-deoxy-D-manno-octulosonic acid kinase
VVETAIQSNGARYRHVDARIFASGDGAIVFDASLSPAPTPEWFDPSYWQSGGRMRVANRGRGGVAFLDAPVGSCVLRHYRRGGLMAPLLGDRYVWNGRDRTRGFAEFRLLSELVMRELPVPVPVAARYRRRGAYYTADLITRTIDGAETLTDLIAARRLDAEVAERVGMLVARFHAAGVDHADLNAHNILSAQGNLWLIDFDRGELRTGGEAWKLANLARLKRSLLKVGACERDEALLEREVWAPLMHGYERTLGTAG